MTEKNQKKESAKKFRNFWTCARPVTQSVPNKRTRGHMIVTAKKMPPERKD